MINSEKLLMEVTGQAGSGKSLLISTLTKSIGNSIFVTAFTGKAAISVRGMTINAAFSIPAKRFG